MNENTVIDLPVADLKFDRNPPRGDLALLVTSILNEGVLEPLQVTWGYDVEHGHARARIAEMLGIKSVPCIVS
jgi:ParB-like chromosome segregation protein Spo0J